MNCPRRHCQHSRRSGFPVARQRTVPIGEISQHLPVQRRQRYRCLTDFGSLTAGRCTAGLGSPPHASGRRRPPNASPAAVDRPEARGWSYRGHANSGRKSCTPVPGQCRHGPSPRHNCIRYRWMQLRTGPMHLPSRSNSTSGGQDRYPGYPAPAGLTASAGCCPVRRHRSRCRYRCGAN